MISFFSFVILKKYRIQQLINLMCDPFYDMISVSSCRLVEFNGNLTAVSMAHLGSKIKVVDTLGFALKNEEDFQMLKKRLNSTVSCYLSSATCKLYNYKFLHY